MSQTAQAGTEQPGTGRTVLTVLTWTWVGVPFLYGVYSLAIKIPALFSS